MRKTGNLCMGLGIILILAAVILLIYNQRQDRDAGEISREYLIELKNEVEKEHLLKTEDSTDTDRSELFSPDEEGEMAYIEVDGNFYIGYIFIPSIGIELPVMKDWSYPKLRLAPCRYFGSVFTDDLVIAAHNYGYHFGSLKRLRPGDLVFFTDVNQIRYSYEVEQVITLEPTDVDVVIESEYPLTLFTCNYSGSMRVTVQCRKLNDTATVR